MAELKDIRNIVTLRRIDDITPIPNADRIETAHIGGWSIVVGKGQHQIGDEVYFFEIDALLPVELPQFKDLAQRGTKIVPIPKTGKMVEGHVLKTARLRGQYSQGLIKDIGEFDSQPTEQDDISAYFEGLGVFKYEKPLSQDINTLDQYPSHLTRPTDSPRIQNLDDDFLASLDPSEWVATEKIDGTSTTIMKDGETGKLRLFSRRLELDIDSLPPGHYYRLILNQYPFEDLLEPGEIIKGETFGPKLQGNPLKVNKVSFALFDWENFHRPLPLELEALKVPVYDEFTLPNTVIGCVEQVNKLKSKINPKVNAEGVVWWNTTGKVYSELKDRPNFKAINNQYLLKNDR